jgi:hypothetical protein
MDSGLRRCRWVTAAVAAAVPWFAQGQGFTADYDLARFSSTEAAPLVKLGPAFSLASDLSSARLSLQAGRNWFGLVQLAHAPAGTLLPVSSHDWINVGGGYRWANGQSLSLQLSRGREPGQRLGLAVNYDWPRYFMRLSFDQGLSLAPQESLRLAAPESLHFSAGVRF